MAAVTPEQAERRLARLAESLERANEGIAQTFAEGVLERAKRKAAQRPTPQARMASQAAYAKRGTVRVSPSLIVSGRGGLVKAGAIAAGSEFGALRYPQFRAPHTTRGYWLHPSAEEAENDRGLLDKADRQLQSLCDATAGFGDALGVLQRVFGRVVDI